MNSPNDIVLAGVYKSYGTKQVLQNFFGIFPAGEITCILGPSGCGKTTLLRLVLGLEKPDSGQISGLGLWNSAAFQENRLIPGLSAMGNLTLACGSVPNHELRRQLLAVGLQESDLEMPSRELSGGMKRRVALVRAMAAHSNLVVLDEPFQGLDADTRRHVMEYIKASRAGRTMLVVTHDPADVQELGAGVLEMT